MDRHVETSHSPGDTLATRRALKRRHLLDAADRVVRRDGPDASMEGIAAEAGITKPILYRHFGDKGGLYRALAERYVSALLERLRAGLAGETEPRSRLRRTLDAYLAFIEQETAAYRFLMHRAVTERPEAHAAIADFVKSVADEIADTIAGQLDELGVDPAPAAPWAHGMVGMAQTAGDWWLSQRTVDRQQMLDYLDALLWKGFEGLLAEIAGADRAD